MKLILRALVVESIAEADPTKRWDNFWLEVTPPGPITISPRWMACLPQFEMMCDAVTSDIQTVEGSGAMYLETIRRVESGLYECLSNSGNAWVTHIARGKVWFEGLHKQPEGGEVTLAQYKLAVETYVKFLADPQHKTIEVEFPDH